MPNGTERQRRFAVAPIVECLKHQPEVEFMDEAYDVTLESSEETSILSTDLHAVGLNQSEQSSDKLAPAK